MRIGVVAWVVVYVAALLALGALDSVWLTTMLPAYQHGLGGLLAATPDLTAAGLFYLLYAAGLVILVVQPGGRGQRWYLVSARGALFGLVAYGTYDLTNYATLRPWSLGLTVSDMVWGAVVTAVASALGIVVGRLLMSLIRPGG